MQKPSRKWTRIWRPFDGVQRRWSSVKRRQQKTLSQASRYFSLTPRYLAHEIIRSKRVNASTQLWTDRYAPQSVKEICGNKGQIEKLQAWLRDWFVMRSDNL